MLDGVVLAEDRGQAHDHAGQGRLGIGRKIFIKTFGSSKEPKDNAVFDLSSSQGWCGKFWLHKYNLS